MSQSPAPGDGDGFTIVVVGATGAVGRDLISVLPRSGLPVREVRLVSSPRSHGTTLDVGEQSHRVHTIAGAVEEAPVFEQADLVFFATPAEVTRAMAPQVAARGAAVIDIGAAMADVAPLVVPSLGRGGLERFVETRIVSSPSAAAVAVATAAAPLQDFGLEVLRGTVMLPAGTVGTSGVEELSGQVVALFSNQDPPRAVFPQGLAFDVLASQTDVVEGWSHAERRLALEVGVLLDLHPERIALTLAMVPTFAGLSLNLFGGVEPAPSLEEVQAAYSEAENVRMADPVPGARRTVGHAGLYVGRLRRDPSGGGVHVWAAADNLRFGAAGNAINIAWALWQEGRL